MIRYSAKTLSPRLVLNDVAVAGIAKKLARKIATFEPRMVIYIKDGGEAVGLEMAGELGIPSRGLDLSYPMSRGLNRTPRLLKAVAWPAKELSYRFASPRLNEPFAEAGDIERFALVDDSASSGKTMRAALRALERLGIDRSRIRTAVIRCGKRARSVVDFFEIEEPVLFRNR